MSIEERLFSIADQCRQQQGDAFLQSSEKLTARLSSQAPDLFAEVKALAAVLSGNDVSRIEAAADADAEAKKVTQEIATREGLGMAVARTAVAVARRIGPLAAGSASAANASDGWAGDSVPAGGGTTNSPPAAPTPPPSEPVYEDDEEDEEKDDKPFWQNKVMLGSAAAVLVAIGYANSGGDTPPGPGGGGGQQPPVSTGGQQPGSTGGGGQQPGGSGGGGNQGADEAVLLQPPGGNIPTLKTADGPNNTTMIGLSVQIQNGVVSGVVMIPKGGWDSAPSMVAFWPAGTTDFETQPGTIGQAIFQRAKTQNGSPGRFSVPQWQQDNIGFKQICVGFEGQGGQDVTLSGSTICILDSQCQQASGCGRVP